MIDDFGNHGSAICEHSMSNAEETMSNTFDCGFKMLRVREPQELVLVQTGFVSRQAQLIADQTKELSEKWTKSAEHLANTVAESARRQSKAA
jgi:hypothetical protein